MKELKEKILKAYKGGDIALLYVLESQAQEKFDEETLIAFYSNILELALERLTDTLESASKLNIEDVQDFATLKALYEYAIEHYSAEKIEDASALFEILSGLCDDESFKSSMTIHLNACNKKVKFDDFIAKYADLEETQNRETFYISSFKKEV